MWTNYGDLNPLEWGGLWIEKDTDHCYRAVVLGITDDEYLFYNCYVDVEDRWINWEDVLESIGEDSLETEEDKVLALLNYYTTLEFGADEKVLSKEEAVEELKAYGIFVS